MSTINQTDVTTDKVGTTTLALSGTEVRGVALSPTENDTDKVPTANALYQGLNTLQQQINKLNAKAFNSDQTVISLPLVSPIFENSGYVYKDWVIYSQQAVYVEDGNDNAILLPALLFPKDGHYLLNIKVSKLPSGHLELCDKDGIPFAVFTAPGDYYIDVTVTSADASAYRLIAKDVTVGDQVTVPYLAIHYVTDRFYNYLINKIGELASVDGTGYVSKALFEARMADMYEDVQGLIAASVGKIDAHLVSKNNPHGVTAAQVGAAPLDHTHTPEAVGAAPANHTHTPKSIGAADRIHIHNEYTTMEDVTTLANALIQSSIKMIHSVAPLSALTAPIGILPDEFQQDGLSEPVQLLITNDWSHRQGSDYDYQAGLAGSNYEPTNGTMAADVFCQYPAGFGQFTLPALELTKSNRLALHYQFHRTRKVAGYSFRHPVDGAWAKKWQVYANFNTFIHLAQRQNNNDLVYTLMLAEPVEASSLTFEIEQITGLDLGINIELLFADMGANEIGVSAQQALLSLPREGNNMLYSLDPTDTIRFQPSKIVPDLPLHVMLNIDPDERSSIRTSYISPEFGVTRTGVDAFLDHYGADDLVVDVLHDPLRHITHPVFGSLSVDLNNLHTDSLLSHVYTTGVDTWEINAPQAAVTFRHSFPEPVYLKGYVLDWDALVKDRIPSQWSLKLTTLNDDDTVEVIIVDSITTYGDKLLPTTKGVRYPKQFDQIHRLTEVELFLATDGDVGLALTNWHLLLTEDFYSIPLNTMMTGNKVSNKFYLGSVVFDRQRQVYQALRQPVIGTLCTLPINDFQLTTVNHVYKLRNPYNTTKIACSLQVLGGDMTIPPSCHVTAITDEEITVRAYSNHRFALSVTRSW